MRLIATLPLLLMLSAALLFTSCQKELETLDPGTGTGNTPGTGTGNPPGTGTGNTPGTGTGNTNTITGEYDFVGLSATTYSSVIVSEQGSELKSVTVSDYVTKNNVGTATITASDIMFMGVGYSIDTTTNGKTYIDGILLMDTDLPFVAAFPPTNTTNPYTRIDDDSLNVVGALGVADPSGVTV